MQQWSPLAGVEITLNVKIEDILCGSLNMASFIWNRKLVLHAFLKS